MNAANTVARNIIRLLKDEAPQWQRDEFYTWHEGRNIWIWTATYQCFVKFRSSRNPGSDSIEPSAYWKWKVWRACKPIKVLPTSKELEAAKLLKASEAAHA
jgi:hypothetical protein